MKIGLFAINFGTCGNPQSAIKVAQAAETAGFESVWTGEHIVLPDPVIPAFPLATETPMLDTTVALTWVAAHTKRLRLASGIILVALRNPAVLAKELASIDAISAGRLIIGVGAGWLEPEFRALGVPMERRGERMDDALRAMRALWTMEHAEHHGPFASFSKVAAYPLEMNGGTTFYFVTDGVESALKQAREAANSKDVRIGGGVATIRQYLVAGAIDEMHLAVSPVLLGEGENLFADINLHEMG